MTFRKNAASHRISIQFDEAESLLQHDGDVDAARPAEEADEKEEAQEMNGRAGESDSPESGEMGDADGAGFLDPNDSLQNNGAEDNAATPNPFETQTSDAVLQSQPPAAVRISKDAAAGPVIAELVATRAELRRVEGELQKAEGGMQKAEHERSSLIDSQTRLQADFDNFRKRTERARGEAHQALIGEITSLLLPIADNFRRAIETSAETSKSEEFKQFSLGIELIRKQLDDVLSAYGVEPVPTVGEPFDPHVHEAIATEMTDEVPPNTIIEEIVRGYRLGDKLLRPAMVKVAAAT